MINQPPKSPIYFPFPTAYVGPLPQNWEKAFGYDGEQRWLAAYWSPYPPLGHLQVSFGGGDEAYMNDGMMSGTANHSVYLDLERNRLPAAIKQAELTMILPSWALGSSDNEPTHCLLCDLQKRLIFIAPIAAASRFMRQKYVKNESSPKLTLARELTEAQLDRLWDAMEEEIKRQSKMAFIVCRNCVNGYTPTHEGYEPCVTCDNRGSWFVEIQEANTLQTAQIHIIWPAKEPIQIIPLTHTE